MKNKLRSFLIINPFGIGDVLFSMPLIKSLKESFPGSKLSYLCNRRVQPILENDPLVDRVFVYERDEFEAVKKVSKLSWIRRVFSFVSQIRKKKIDIAIDLSLNSQFGFFSRAAGIKNRIGYDYKGRGRFLTKKIKLQGYEKKPVAEYYLELLNLIGVNPRFKESQLNLSRDQKDKATDFLKKRGIDGKILITITPCGGASWGSDSYRKHWDKNKFAELADKLIDKYDAGIILAGSGEEKAVIDQIESLMKNRPIKAINLPLLDFFALLERSALLVTNDGGPVHMAAALGVKTASIFGPVDEAVYGPYPKNHKKHVVIKKDLPCRPCYKKFRLPQCQRGLECLRSITVEEVFAAVNRLL